MGDEYEEDYDYDYDREMNASVGEEMQQVADPAETEEHLKTRDVFGHQKIILYAHVTASLKELQSNPAKASWRLSGKELDAMKFNIRKTNRTNATSEERTGDITRVIPLTLRVISAGSNFDIGLTANGSGLEGRVCVGKEPALWVFPPNSPSQRVDEEVGNPDSRFTAEMFKKVMACDRESLKKQLLFGKGSNEHIAHADAHGHVWKEITRCARNPKFASCADAIYEYDAKRLEGSLDSNMIPIPLQLAEYVHAKITKDLDEIEKSYINMNDFEIKFGRVDGKAWDDCLGLVGEAAAYDDDSRQTLHSTLLTTQHTVHVLCEFGYLI